jgi:hypothetical protein
MEDLKKQYQDFIENLKEPLDRKSIDYLGVNVFEKKKEPVFKIYYATKASPCRDHPLISYLYARDMLRDFEMVKDTISSTYLRLDMAIKHRNNTNIQMFLDQLKDYSDLYCECKDEVYQLAKMKITDSPEYQYASLYHLGITQENERTESLKWYFLTRWCQNPDQPGRNSEYRDAYYLDYLTDTEIFEYQILVKYVNRILEGAPGHLWLIGMDVKTASYRKYKIYIKDLQISYEQLEELLDGRIKFAEVESWHQEHSEFELEGIALCLDTEGDFSVNLYFGCV